MYCSNCANALNPNLKYCNNCGMRVDNQPVSAKNPSAMLGIGAVFIGMVGLMAFYPILRELLRNPIHPVAVVAIMVVYLVAVISMFSVLLISSRRETGKRNAADTDYASPSALRVADTAQLREPTEMPASVTENTTRTLDQVKLTGR